MQPTNNSGMWSSLSGIVHSLELKSGINPLLFLNAILGVPSIAGYAFSGKSILLWFVSIPLALTCFVYVHSFFKDKNFLRSEKYNYNMRKLDMLGDKENPLTPVEIQNIPSVINPYTNKKLGQGK